MKKITLLLMPLFAALGLSAQNVYEHSVSQQAYTDLTDATSINMGQVWDWDDFGPFAMPFEFTVAGDEITHFGYYDDSFVLVIADGGEDDYYDIFTSAAFIQDRTYNSGMSSSPLSYKVEGEAGSRILKLEAKNVGLEEDPEGDGHYFMNFQIWLYESDNAIEIRYGESNITDISVLGTDDIFLMGLGGLENAYLLYGDSDNPTYGEFTEETFPAGGVTLDAFPAEGTVYRLAPDEVAGVNDWVVQTVTLYPNPVSNVLNFTSRGFTGGEYNIYDITGKMVKQGALNNTGSGQINVGHLSAGVYTINIDGQNLKFIKE